MGISVKRRDIIVVSFDDRSIDVRLAVAPSPDQ